MSTRAVGSRSRPTRAAGARFLPSEPAPVRRTVVLGGRACRRDRPTARRASRRSTARDGMPNGWVDSPLVFVSIAEDGTVTHRLPSLRDGAGRAHQHADDRRRRARGRLEARARRAGAGRREASSATRTPTARAARGTSSSRCAAAAPRRADARGRRGRALEGAGRRGAGARTTRSCTGRRGRRLGYGALAKAAAAKPVPARDDAAAEGPGEVPLHRQGRAQLVDGRDIVDRQGAVRHRHAAARACSTPSSRGRPCSAARWRASTPPRR